MVWLRKWTEEEEALIQMSEEDFDEKMCKEFPGIFRDRHASMQETCMCWGFCVGSGWRPILYEVCRKLALMQELTGLEVVADQIKEKFGGLRFYYHTLAGESVSDLVKGSLVAGEIISDLVNVAEEKADHTCETCGERGRRRGGSWLRTLCPKCAVKKGYAVSEEEQDYLDREAKEKEEKIDEGVADTGRDTDRPGDSGHDDPGVS